MTRARPGASVSWVIMSRPPRHPSWELESGGPAKKTIGRRDALMSARLRCVPAPRTSGRRSWRPKPEAGDGRAGAPVPRAPARARRRLRRNRPRPGRRARCFPGHLVLLRSPSQVSCRSPAAWAAGEARRWQRPRGELRALRGETTTNPAEHELLLDGPRTGNGRASRPGDQGAATRSAGAESGLPKGARSRRPRSNHRGCATSARLVCIGMGNGIT
jgi:hypothetical protein